MHSLKEGWIRMQYDSEHIIRLTLEMLPLPVIIHDFNEIYYYNCRAKNLLSVGKSNDSKRYSVYDFIHPHYHHRVEERHKNLPKMKLGDVYEDELKVVNVDGNMMDIDVFSTIVLYHNKPMLITGGRDVTLERSFTTEVMQRAEKLNIVGQMAAGIAHEIRNPLTSIRGFIQLMKENEASDSSIMQLMLNEIDRINLIVSQFLVLAKPEVLQFKPVHVGVLMDEVKALLEPESIMRNVRIQVKVDPQMPSIRGDMNQLKQVLINLVKNSVEASPNNSYVYMEADYANQGYIRISVHDQGTGIPEEKLPKLGEPFFTTKKTGTGLGLMVSFKIIETHRGVMNIQSELGKGTSIDITLPIHLSNFFEENELGITNTQQFGT